jgi:hypothetical protein
MGPPGHAYRIARHQATVVLDRRIFRQSHPWTVVLARRILR